MKPQSMMCRQLWKESKRLYPYEYGVEIETTDAQRAAHISCARQYMGEIDRLKSLLKNTVTPNCECEACRDIWNEFKEKHNL